MRVTEERGCRRIEKVPYSSTGIRSGETLREGLFDTYLEPASEGERLLLLPLLSVETLPLLDLYPTSLSTTLPLLLLLRLKLRPRSLSSFPSMASSKRLFRGPSSPLSSSTSRFAMRGRIMSHTRSSRRSWSTNSSIYVRTYPPSSRIGHEETAMKLKA